MPKITIDNNNRGIPTTTGQPKEQYISSDLSVAKALGTSAEVLSDVGNKFTSKAKTEIDSQYIANTSIQMQKNLEALSAKSRELNAGDPRGHADTYIIEAEKIINDSIINAPSQEARNVFMSQLPSMRARAYHGELAFEKQALKTNAGLAYDKALIQLTEDINKNPSDFNYTLERFEQQIEALEVAGISPESIEATRKSGQQGLAKSMIVGMDSLEAKQAVESGVFDSIFSPTERDTISRGIERDINQRETEAKKQQAAAKTEYMDSLYNGSVAGTTTENDLWHAFGSGRINGIEYKKQVDFYNSIVGKKADTASSVELLNSAIEGNINLDPARHEKQISSAWDEVIQPKLDAIEDPQERLSSMLNSIKEIGVVPKSVSTKLQANIANGSNKEKIQASMTLSAILDNNPDTAVQFNTNTKAKARAIDMFAQVKTNPEEIIKAAEVQVFEKGTELYNSKVEEFNNNKSEFDLDILDQGIFFSESSINQDVARGAKVEFERLYRHYFMSGGLDIEVAKDQAEKDIKSMYGYDDVSEEVMKYPPSKFYGKIDGKSDWIKKQLVNDINKIALPESIGNSKLDEDIVLIYNPKSKNRREPSYFVGIYGRDSLVGERNGVLNGVLDSKGENMIWQPDIELEDPVKTVIGKSEEERRRVLQERIEERQVEQQERGDVF